MTRFTKVSPTGLLLPADATEWVAVYDSKLDVTWDKAFHAMPDWHHAHVLPRLLKVAGFTDWRAPTVEELYCLADRRRAYPVIDTYFFPDTPSERFWASDAWAPSHADCAWIVHFGGGSSCWVRCGAAGFVRAVRDGGGR